MYLPKDHRFLAEERSRRKIGDQVQVVEGSHKVVDVLNAALPDIKAFVSSKVSPAVSSGDVGTPLANGHANGGTAPIADFMRQSAPNGLSATGADGMNGASSSAALGMDVDEIAIQAETTSVVPAPAAEDQIMA